MLWERRLLLDQETQSSDSATRRITLPRSGFLSGLEVRTRVTNGATSGLEKVFEAIDRVEVIADGSTVLLSLEGVELYRWGHFIYGVEPPHRQDQQAAVVQELVLPVLFGRYFGDPEFCLDLARYRDVELRIQYSPTIAATEFATGTTQFHIPMWISEASPAGRRGYLRIQQVKAFTSVASGEERTELARLNPYYDIMVYAREAAVPDGTDITIAAIELNDGRIIPYYGRWDDWQSENEKLVPVNGEHRGIMLRGDTETFDTHTGRIWEAEVTPIFVQSDANGIVTQCIGSITGDQLAMSVSDLADAAATTHFTAAAADRPMLWRARGLGVGNAILLPFALKGNPDFALDPTQGDISKLELVLTNGAAGAAVRISTREIVTG